MRRGGRRQRDGRARLSSTALHPARGRKEQPKPTERNESRLCTKGIQFRPSSSPSMLLFHFPYSTLHALFSFICPALCFSFLSVLIIGFIGGVVDVGPGAPSAALNPYVFSFWSGYMKKGGLFWSWSVLKRGFLASFLVVFCLWSVRSRAWSWQQRLQKKAEIGGDLKPYFKTNQVAGFFPSFIPEFLHAMHCWLV